MLERKLKLTLMETLKLIGKRLYLNDRHFFITTVLLILYAASYWWLPQWLPNFASIDPGIWQLVMVALLVFLLVLPLCWGILAYAVQRIGLPALTLIFAQFKLLTLWQQFIIYWLSFFSLVFLALLSLMAIL